MLAIATELVNPDVSSNSKLSTTIGGLTLGLPALGIGSWLLSHSYSQTCQKIENHSRRIHAIFFNLVKQNNGQITVSHLTKYTQLSQQEARIFIQKKAVEFNATVEIKPDGETIDHFPQS